MQSSMREKVQLLDFFVNLMDRVMSVFLIRFL